MVPVGRYEILSRFAEIPTEILINYILRLHVKNFILARLDSSFLKVSSFIVPLLCREICQEEIFLCNRFIPPKQDEK